MHTCIICIGSNYNRKENLAFARRRLTESFPGIAFAGEEETEPVGLKNPALFSNQVALVHTELDESEVSIRLKDIEREAGRTPEDKKKERITLDIDLLIYDTHILKPEETGREYIIRGISRLSESTNKNNI